MSSRDADFASLSTEALFGRRALARLGDMLANQFRIAGLMAVPPSTLWADAPIDDQTAQGLDHLTACLSPILFSRLAADRYAAPVEPLHLRLLRRHDGIGPLPKAVMMPRNGDDLDDLLHRADQAGLSVANPATGEPGILAFLAHNMTYTDDTDASNGILRFAPGVSWAALQVLADKHKLALPSGLSDRFESPFRAATAGLFKGTDFKTHGAHPVDVTVHLEPKGRGWLDAIYLFKDHVAATAAMAHIVQAVPPLYAGQISDIDLKTGAALGFWRVGAPLWGKHSYTGLRLIYQDGLMVSRAKLAEAGLIALRHGGRAWRAGPMLGRSRQLEALYYSGAGLAGIDQRVLAVTHHDPAAATLGDTAASMSQFPGTRPVVSTTYIKTAHGPLIRRSRVHYARDLAQGVAEAIAIGTAGTKTELVPPTIPPQSVSPSLCPSGPDPEATSKTAEWQAIRDALMAQIHEPAPETPLDPHRQPAIRSRNTS